MFSVPIVNASEQSSVVLNEGESEAVSFLDFPNDFSDGILSWNVANDKDSQSDMKFDIYVTYLPNVCFIRQPDPIKQGVLKPGEVAQDFVVANKIDISSGYHILISRENNNSSCKGKAELQLKLQ